MNKKNKEGYSDPTAYKALSKIEREERELEQDDIDYKKLKSVLNQVCELQGCKLKGQISIVNKRNGRTYRF